MNANPCVEQPNSDRNANILVSISNHQQEIEPGAKTSDLGRRRPLIGIAQLSQQVQLGFDLVKVHGRGGLRLCLTRGLLRLLVLLLWLLVLLLL